MERQAKDGTIYQQVGKDEWQPVTRQAKDGTVYKKVGQDDWAPLQEPMSENIPSERILGGLLSKQTAQNWVNTLPTIGALGGGAAGAGVGLVGSGGALSVPGGVAGAGLGAYGGKYLEGALETYFDLPEKPRTRAEAHIKPLKEGAIAATGEGVGLNVANAFKGKGYSAADIAKIKALESGELGTEAIKREVPAGLLNLKEEMFQAVPKENVSDILQAAQRLGVEPTPGMLTSNRNIQNLEEVLSKRPTLAGEYIRRRYTPIREGLSETAEQVGQRTASSPYELGTEAQKQIVGKIGERLDPLKASYDEIAQSTSKASIDPAMASRAARGLLRTPIASTSGTETHNVAKRFGEMYVNAKNAQDIQNIVSEAKDLARSSDGKIRLVANKSAQAGERLLRRGLMKSGKTSGGSEGADIAKGLIKDLRETNKGYRSLATDIDSAIGELKLKSSSPGDVIRKLDEMPSEQVAERLFNPKNVDALEKLKKFSPEGFEAIRQNRLNKIVEQSLTKGQVDPAKLVRNFKGLPKEVKAILVGKENVAKLGDAETILNSFPDIVNPSRTSVGLAWGNYLNPGQYLNEASDVLKLRALQTGKIPYPVRAAIKTQGLLKKPMSAFPDLIPPAVVGTAGLIRSRQDERGQ